MKKILHQCYTKIAAVIAVFGFLFSTVPLIYAKLHPAVALNLPVQIHMGNILSEEFEAAFSEVYTIKLFIKIRCDLIDNDNDCPAIPEIKWTVSNLQSIVDTNRTTPVEPSSWSSDGTGFRLGRFSAVAGNKYKIEVSSSQDIKFEKLRDARLIISLNQNMFDKLYMIINLTQLFGFLLLFVGVIFLFGIFVYKKLKYRQ